jgi:hypothetical protein
MPWLGSVTVIGIVALAVLIWFFLRTRSKDLLEEIIARRKPSSRQVSRAEYVQGMQRVPVALSLTTDAIFYENPDLEASFELARIEEIEYDDELVTGRRLDHGCRALRLRSHGAAFEFILNPPDCEKWMAALPPRRMEATARAV